MPATMQKPKVAWSILYWKKELNLNAAEDWRRKPTELENRSNVGGRINHRNLKSLISMQALITEIGSQFGTEVLTRLIFEETKPKTRITTSVDLDVGNKLQNFDLDYSFGIIG